MNDPHAMTAEQRRVLTDALAAHQRGDLDIALNGYDTLLAEIPDNAAILSNRASIRLSKQDFGGAKSDAEKAARLDASSFGAWFNLGLAFRKSNELAAASRALARASALRSGDARALIEWFSAAALSQQPSGIAARVRQPIPALANFRQRVLDVATELERHGFGTAAMALLTQLRRELPNDSEVVARQQTETEYGRAALLEHRGETNAAMVAVDELLIKSPAHRGAQLLKASVFGERGEVSLALQEYRRLVESTANDAISGSAMLIAMQHDPASTACEIFAAHRDWANRIMPFIAEKTTGVDARKNLRIGWISPRFFNGLVGTFFLDTLRHLRRDEMTHVLYDVGGIGDETTEQFRATADELHVVDELDDLSLAEKIRDDRIDVLIEMSGHSPGNRLRALATRPAPVQATWLDYFHSTGSDAVDFLISDHVLSPAELLGNYTERVIVLPSGRLCYSPPQSSPDITTRTRDAVRFCSFNRVDKINDDVLRCWSRILSQVDKSMLRLKARAFDREDDRAHFLSRCQRFGISSLQLELLGFGTHSQTSEAYVDADIALDPFPFSGCATSFDALWMGLPVVTKIGDTMVSRQTASILTSLDLKELITHSDDEYVSCAVDLARDSSRLEKFRGELRGRMREGVGDVSRHADELSDALRQMWRSHCSPAG